MAKQTVICCFNQKRLGAPCIFNCFKYLLSPTRDVKGNDYLFDKFQLVLTYSSQPVAGDLKLLDFTAIRKRLLIFLLLSEKEGFSVIRNSGNNITRHFEKNSEERTIVTQKEKKKMRLGNSARC